MAQNDKRLTLEQLAAVWGDTVGTVLLTCSCGGTFWLRDNLLNFPAGVGFDGKRAQPVKARCLCGREIGVQLHLAQAIKPGGSF